jgi:DNA-binding HxlR family transcriptional regulator
MKSYDQYCGLALALDRVGGRWTLLLIRELLTGPKRYSDLASGMPGVAPNLLSSRLKALMGDGLVERRELPPPAASVVYELTPQGRELEAAVLALVRWGGQFMRRRTPDQAFRAHWAVVALRALLQHRPPLSTSLVVRWQLSESEVTLRFGQSVDIDDTGAPPGVVAACAPEILLGLAAGELAWEDALDAGFVASGGDGAIQSLRRHLTGLAEST